MKLTLLPTCLQCHLPAKVLEVDFIYWCHFITDMIVYTYAEFGMNCLENKWNITHCPECCVGSWLQCRLLVCRTPSSYCSSLTIQSNILDTMFNQTIQWMSKKYNNNNNLCSTCVSIYTSSLQGYTHHTDDRFVEYSAQSLYYNTV